MRSGLPPCRVRLLPVTLLTSLLLATAVAAQGPRHAPVVPGDPFPPSSHANLNVAAGGPERIDLADYLGKKPVILYYWMVTHTRSQRVFQELQDLVEEAGSDRVAFFGVAVPRPGYGEDKIRERLETLAIRVPVLNDEGFGIGERLIVSSVPNVTIVDAEGRLRLSNGASLAQVIGYDLDLAKAIRRTIETGKLMTHGYLDPYFPVKELEGAPSPDFRAPLLETGVERRWLGMLDDAKVNVLIFWSVSCSHCRKVLPEISAWLGEHPDAANVVSCAAVKGESAKVKTLEFCKLHEFRFPTLVDADGEIGDLYKVTSTPTILFVGPDGVVDSVVVSSVTDFGRMVEERRKKLVGTAR